MNLPTGINISIKTAPTSSCIKRDSAVCIELSEENVPLSGYLEKSITDALSLFCALHTKTSPAVKQECDEIISMGG